MSTYLVAFLVSDFDYKERTTTSGIKVRTPIPTIPCQSLFHGPRSVTPHMPSTSIGCDPFPERSHKILHGENHSKISNLMITQLLYLDILNMKRDSLHTRSFERINLPVFWHILTKNSFVGLKNFQRFRETGPCFFCLMSWGHKGNSLILYLFYHGGSTDISIQ